MGDRGTGQWLLSGQRANFFDGDALAFTGEVVFGREEEHTVTLFPFAHGDTRAVPVGGFDFGFLVFVVTTGAKGGSKVFLVFGESFEDHRCDTGINAKVRVGALCIAFGKAFHEVEVFLGGLSHGRTRSF
jgi:hypothetical protein